MNTVVTVTRSRKLMPTQKSGMKMNVAAKLCALTATKKCMTICAEKIR